MSVPLEPASPCSPSPGECRSYWPGHALHHIQAELAARPPCGWRDATVVDVGDTALSLAYVDANAVTDVRRHLTFELTSGTALDVSRPPDVTWRRT